jgi:hypothetical protein
MPCNPGCLCNTCCKAARAFAIGHWNLQEFENHTTAGSHNSDWRRLENGSARKQHRTSA